MAGSTHSRIAPCVGVVVPWNPDCTLGDTAWVFKPSGDTPFEVAPEYFDDREYTEYATDNSLCGPILDQRGNIKREEVTVRRCMTDWDLRTVLSGSQSRAVIDGGGITTGYIDSSDPTVTSCAASQPPALLVMAVYPVGFCGSSGYCAANTNSCVVEGWVWGTNPRVTQRSQAAASDPFEFSFWSYAISDLAAGNIPANILSIFPVGNTIVGGDTHFEETIDCALVPTPGCDPILTADLFT